MKGACRESEPRDGFFAFSNLRERTMSLPLRPPLTPTLSPKEGEESALRQLERQTFLACSFAGDD